jgi:hypothetical protein
MMFLPKTNSFIAMTIVAISLTVFVFGETTTNVIMNNKHRALKKINNKHRALKKKMKGKKGKKTNNDKLACNKKLFEGDWEYSCCGGRTFAIDVTCIRDDCIYTEFEIFEDGTADTCILGGAFSASSKIEFDRTTGICNLSYIDLNDVDPCDAINPPESQLGLKAEINIKGNNDDVTMLLRFSDDGGTLFYNEDEPREAMRT